MKDIELNKWIHENVMGECWHELEHLGASSLVSCSKCGTDDQEGNFDDAHPNYCSDLNVIAKTEAKVIAKESYQRYGLTLSIIVDKAQPGLVWEKVRYGLIATATARQRAEACKIVWNWQAARLMREIDEGL